MELLKKLTQICSPSGSEDSVCEFIKNEISSYADDVYTDSLGNLIAHKKGEGKRLMLSAHMDEIGLLVNYIEENGFLRFSPIGGVMPYSALYQRVEFVNGVKGVVSYEEKADLKKSFDVDKMYIDIGASNIEEASKLVSIGDSAAFIGKFEVVGGCVVSKALDNRAGVYVLMQVLKQMKHSKNEVYFVFSGQEEVGCRGAKAAANEIKPDIALAVDVTSTGDTPNCNRMAVKLGMGPCIKYMDKSIITHKYVNDCLKLSCEKSQVAVQSEVLTVGGTDAGVIHVSGAGVKTGAVSIPVRYIHTPCETASLNDINGAVKLISEFINLDF